MRTLACCFAFLVLAAGRALAADAPAAGKVVLPAEESAGGLVITMADGSKAVTLDRSCPDPRPQGPGMEWKLAMAAGWWHGTIEWAAREGDDKGWVNTHVGVALMTPEKPLVNVMNNMAGDREPTFDFWLYSSSPAEGVRIQPVYDQLWRYKRTWPIRRVTFEHVDAPAITESDPATLDLPVGPDGAVSLPLPLPVGQWTFRAAMKKPGTLTCVGADGRAIEAPFNFDQWRRPYPIYTWADSPVREIQVKSEALFKNVVLEHTVARPAESIATEGAPMATVDPARSVSAELVLEGAGLTGEAPAFPLLPRGLKTAVVTTWDDGAAPDMRLAEMLNRLGYHPTFFLNQNNPAMKLLDKLEALGVEIGSHCYHHPSLYILPPQRAAEECVEMRKLLEKELGHPVISLGYPNGYFPAYDAQGDYVLRGMRAAGYWSGRTTATAAESIEALAAEEPLALKTDGFFGNRESLEAAWKKAREQAGGVFQFWGHSWQIGQTDEQWQSFETFITQFARQPDAWYASQGELFLWLWARKNVQVAVTAQTPTKVTAKLTRPWLHPYLAGKCPLSLRVPPGVTSARWQGKDVPIVNGCVELPWP